MSEYIGYLDFTSRGRPSAPRSTRSSTEATALQQPRQRPGLSVVHPRFDGDCLPRRHDDDGMHGTCDDLAADDGNLFITKVSGAPIRMAAADDPPDPADRNASVEPTFNPIPAWWLRVGRVHQHAQMGQRPLAERRHGDGTRERQAAALGRSRGPRPSARWIPSHPAIYLEGQEDTPNMRGFFTLSSCVATTPPGATDAATQCVNGFQCCSGFCNQGQCMTSARWPASAWEVVHDEHRVLQRSRRGVHRRPRGRRP